MGPEASNGVIVRGITPSGGIAHLDRQQGNCIEVIETCLWN
jgi:hypothetical protein